MGKELRPPYYIDSNHGLQVPVTITDAVVMEEVNRVATKVSHEVNNHPNIKRAAYAAGTVGIVFCAFHLPGFSELFVNTASAQGPTTPTPNPVATRFAECAESAKNAILAVPQNPAVQATATKALQCLQELAPKITFSQIPTPTATPSIPMGFNIPPSSAPDAETERIKTFIFGGTALTVVFLALLFAWSHHYNGGGKSMTTQLSLPDHKPDWSEEQKRFDEAILRYARIESVVQVMNSMPNTLIQIMMICGIKSRDEIDPSDLRFSELCRLAVKNPAEFFARYGSQGESTAIMEELRRHNERMTHIEGDLGKTNDNLEQLGTQVDELGADLDKTRIKVDNLGNRVSLQGRDLKVMRKHVAWRRGK